MLNVYQLIYLKGANGIIIKPSSAMSGIQTITIPINNPNKVGSYEY